MTDEDSAGWWNDTYSDHDVVPWETGEPQPALVERAEAGDIGGRVLDVGCGLGTEALYLADRGHAVVGVDRSREAVDRARRRAVERSLDERVTFRVADARSLPVAKLGSFETAIDCGLLHAMPPDQRREYAASLASVLPPGATAVFVEFGADAPDDWGPVPLGEADIREALDGRFRIDAVEPSRYITRTRPVAGLVAVATRTVSPEAPG